MAVYCFRKRNVLGLDLWVKRGFLLEKKGKVIWCRGAEDRKGTRSWRSIQPMVKSLVAGIWRLGVSEAEWRVYKVEGPQRKDRAGDKFMEKLFIHHFCIWICFLDVWISSKYSSSFGTGEITCLYLSSFFKHLLMRKFWLEKIFICPGVLI